MLQRADASSKRLTVRPRLTAGRLVRSVLAAAVLAYSPGCTSMPAVPDAERASLRYFGYALVDCAFDDPLDADRSTSYVSEVAPFTNIAQLCVFDPAENIQGRLALMSQHRIRALLSVQAIFFVGTPDSAQGSGTKFTLHPQYRARWEAFVRNNDLLQQNSAIAAFYIADEPVWNGIAYADLKAAADIVDASFPGIPSAIIEAHASLADLQVPESVDWIGFDHYAIPRPAEDPGFRRELALLKSKRSHPSQRIVLVMDAQWLPFYGEAGYPESHMATVARSYHDMARADPEVIGIIGYLWPGGLDHPQQKGVRNLPQSVIAEHRRIGRSITGK